MVSITSWAPGKIRRGRRQLQRRQLQQDEEMVAEHRLDRRRAQIGDLVGLVDGAHVLDHSPQQRSDGRGRARRRRSS